MSEWGSEVVTFFEIDQPICARTYGQGPCTAVLGSTGTRKCYNTLATCQDPAHYAVVETMRAAAFDGNVDYLRRVAGLTGAADSKKGIISAWVRVDAGSGSDRYILTDATTLGGGTVRYGLWINGATNNVEVFGYNTAGAIVLYLTGGTLAVGTAWRHILISWDLSSGGGSPPNNCHFYLDDVYGITVNNFTNTNIDYTTADFSVGATCQGTFPFSGALAEIYFFQGEYLDFSITANRRKFITAGLLPEDLGADGSTPTGSAPTIYLSVPVKGPAYQFSSNLGSGGSFTIFGSLDNASTAPFVVLPDSVLTLTFAHSQEGLLQYGNVSPSIISLDTTPASINLGSMNRSNSALGQREVVTITLNDHLHSDHLVDPYRTQRNLPDGSPQTAEMFDPYTRGTFWGKWIARNPYAQHSPCRVREGVLGDALSDMRVRHYVLDSISGPSNGVVKIVLKDAFSIIEKQKAVAPLASRGELLSDITAVATSATLSPAGIGDLDYPYPAGSPSELLVAIGDEAMLCTRSGDVLTILTRGALNTTAEAHKSEDLVQLVLSYARALATDIVYDLLTNYTSIDPASIDTAQWAIDNADLADLYTAKIVEPTPVVDLIGELAEQATFTVWPDVTTGMIKFIPLRAQVPTVTIDDDAWIVDGSLSIKRQTDRRASQVWVYYGQVDPTMKLDERRNYRSRVVTADPAAEAEEQYGTPAIREIFSRWIPQFGRSSAASCGERILAMFRDPPIEAKFALHVSRIDDLGLARYFTMQTAEVQDDTGDMLDVVHATVEMERGESEVIVRSQQVTFFTETADLSGSRVIYIENDVYNINLRTIHDSLYAAPVAGSPSQIVRFVVLKDMVVGSASPSLPAMDTGSWPSGVSLSLEIHGRIEGAGGGGGVGGSVINHNGSAGNVGTAGGTAFKATYQIDIVGNGIIAGGGGGGGGGGGVWDGFFFQDGLGGGGGGGGAGRLGGVAAVGGLASGNQVNYSGNPGSNGTLTSGGAGGASVVRQGGLYYSGAGGIGGALGTVGTSGGASVDAYNGAAVRAGGAGGAAGAAIQGISFCRFAGSPTELTITGSTS